MKRIIGVPVLLAALLAGGSGAAVAEDAAATLQAIESCKDRCAASYSFDSPDSANCATGCATLSTACAEDPTSAACEHASNPCADASWAAIHTEECPKPIASTPGATAPAGTSGGNQPVGGGNPAPAPTPNPCPNAQAECPNPVGSMSDPATELEPQSEPVPDLWPSPEPMPDFSPHAMPDFSPGPEMTPQGGY